MADGPGGCSRLLCKNSRSMQPSKPPRFLLTNDDGIEAPGLAALQAALPEGADFIVVAPREELSACSHQVTTSRPICARRIGERRFEVDSWPADCVRVAARGMRNRFDWVLAGINHGANLGADVYYSGTVAAVREAALLGLPAIAVSHYRDRVLSESDWRRATEWVRNLLPHLLKRPLARGCFWNVNLPSLPSGSADPPVVECDVDTSPVDLTYATSDGRYTYTGVYSRRGRQAGRDVDTCFGGNVAVSLMRLP